MTDTLESSLIAILAPYRGGQYYLDIPGWRIKGKVPKRLFSKAIHYGHIQNIDGIWYIINVEEWHKRNDEQKESELI